MEISPRGPGRMGPSGRAGAAGLAWTRLPEPARAAPAVGPVRVVGTATGPGGHSGRLRASVPEPCTPRARSRPRRPPDARGPRQVTGHAGRCGQRGDEQLHPAGAAVRVRGTLVRRSAQAEPDTSWRSGTLGRSGAPWRPPPSIPLPCPRGLPGRVGTSRRKARDTGDGRTPLLSCLHLGTAPGLSPAKVFEFFFLSAAHL